MTQYRDFNAQQQSALRSKSEAVKCKTCACEWFEQVRATKVDMNIFCTLGQQAPEDNDLAYSQILLRCLRCNDLQELPVNLSSAHKNMLNSYTDLTKALEKISEKK